MEDDCPKCSAGLPPWLATFADLMSLLMCFFVLLLSFAEVDAIRFKKMAESMKDAFGVQRKIPANEIVKGVSVIKQEWSPSVKEQAVISELRQETSDVEKEHLDLNDQGGQGGQDQKGQSGQSDQQIVVVQAQQLIEQELEEQFAELQESLEQEIEAGLVTVDKEKTRIIIRIQERGSFPSGRASLDPDFHEVLARISAVLAAKPGKILVAGHTDNIPIRTGRFRSNWELSAARAVTVLHSMLRDKLLDPNRVLVEGYADTVPLATNANAEGRAQNRRVELVLIRGTDEEGGNLQAAPAATDEGTTNE